MAHRNPPRDHRRLLRGPPRDGVVELGYAVSPSWEGRGIATAAVGELLRDAYTAPDVRGVIAHTLPETGPSVRVLGKSGFLYESAVVTDGVGTTWRFRHDRDASYQAFPCRRVAAIQA
jgi:RimJ/RimL family protein N-acetyltransferase